MSKDAGNEWTIQQELDKSTTWEIDTSDYRAGLFMETLKLIGKDDLHFSPPTVDYIQTLFPPDQYEIELDTPQPGATWMTTCEVRIFPVGKTDNPPVHVLQMDPVSRFIAFQNYNPAMEEIVRDHYVNDPTEGNIRIFEQLSSAAEHCGFPVIDHTIKLEVHNHLRTTAQKENENLPQVLADRRAREEAFDRHLAEQKEWARQTVDGILLPLCLESNPILANSLLNPAIFPDPEINAMIIENSYVKLVSEIASLFEAKRELLNDPQFIDYLRKYLKSAGIGHNWFPADQIRSINGRSKHERLLERLDMSTELDSLSATIVSPDTNKFQRAGTGWSDRTGTTYILPFAEYAGQCLSFNGDIDDPDGYMLAGGYENPTSHCLLIQHTAILQAILDYEWDKYYEQNGRNYPSLDYNEVLVFARVDWSKYTPVRQSTAI